MSIAQTFVRPFMVLKELFIGENILIKHLSLFCIAALTGFTSNSIAGLIIGIILTFYLFGYYIEAVHYKLNTGIDVLPEITFSPFSTFLKALPLILVWIFYYIIIVGIFAVPIILTHSVPVAIISFIILSLCLCMIYYIFIAYAKNYNSVGMYSLMLPFQFMPLALWETIITDIAYIIISILIFLIVIGVYVLLKAVLPDYAVTIATGISCYIEMILTLTFINSLAVIYEEKIEGTVIEEL